MFHNPKAPYTTSNNFTNFTPNFYTRPYILSHVVPTFFASAPPEEAAYMKSNPKSPTLVMVSPWN